MVCFCSVVAYSLVGIASALLLGLFYFRRIDKKLFIDFAKRNIKYVSLPNIVWMSLRGRRLEMVQLEEVKKHGTVFGTSVMMSQSILVAEPDLIQMVLSKEFTNFTDRRAFKLNDELSDSFLSIVAGEKWKRLRSIITPTFASGKLRQMQPRIDMALQTLIENITSEMEKTENEVDIKKLFGSFTMNTIVQVSFGMKIDSLNDDHPVIKYAKKAFSNINLKNLFIFWILLFAPQIAQKFKLRANAEITDFFKDFATKIIDKRKKDLAELRAKGESFKATNFLDFMIENESEVDNTSTSEEEKKSRYISNIEMIAQSVLFFLAGYETTAGALTFVIHSLMLHPEIQERVYDEIQTVLGELEQENGHEDTRKGLELVTLDTLPRFELLGAVLDETLRLYAPANFIERVATNDILIESEDKSKKLEVKKGDIIHIPVYVVHRDERYFPDPEKFDPDRFLGERAKEHHKYSYIPFGAGPRNCVARTFAIMEARMALLHTIYNFRFSVSKKTEIPPKYLNQAGLVSPKECFTSVEQRNH